MIIITAIYSKVYYRTVFTCAACGVTAEGNRDHVQLTTDTADQLKTSVEKITESPGVMPVGWASFYGEKKTIYKCPRCKETT